MQFTVFGVLFWFAGWVLLGKFNGSLTIVLCTIPAILAIKSVGLVNWKENVTTFLFAVVLPLPFLYLASKGVAACRDGGPASHYGVTVYSVFSPALYVGSIIVVSWFLDRVFSRNRKFSGIIELDKLWVIYFVVIPLILLAQMGPLAQCYWSSGRVHLRFTSEIQFGAQFLYVALVSIIGGIRGKKAIPSLVYTLIMLVAIYLLSDVELTARHLPKTLAYLLPGAFLLTASIVWEVVYRKWFVIQREESNVHSKMSKNL